MNFSSYLRFVYRPRQTRSSAQRELSQQTKNDSDTPSRDGSVAVIRLAVEQMIDFFAKFVEIIQTEINDRITDISYLIHFL